MEVFGADIWVVGSGAAGLAAAIAARRQGMDVKVVGKARPGRGTATLLSGGGFTGAWDGGRAEEHRTRTLTAGRGLNEHDLVEALVAEAPERFRELIGWGLEVESRPGHINAKGQAPIFGENIVRCLVAKADEVGVAFQSHLVVRGLAADDAGAFLVAYAPDKGGWVGLVGRAVVLASGGAGALYRRHDNPQRITGDSYALAFAAGAPLQDLEFVQFYPLCLAEPGLPPLLIPPGATDRGRIINDRGEDILVKYGITKRPAGERERDRLSQAIFREIEREGREVFANLTTLSDKDWRGDSFSSNSREFLCRRCSLDERPVRLAPAAHFMVGGVCVDTAGATSVPGLFAAGEAAGGLHGANRLGGNALSETVVFGTRAGLAAAAWAGNRREPGKRGSEAQLTRFIPEPARGASEATAAELLARLRRVMWEDVGVLRNRADLERGRDAIAEIAAAAARTGGVGEPDEFQRILEVQLAAQAASLIVEAALRREESRGAHFREDFPQSDDAKWLGHIKVQRKNGDAAWNFERSAVWGSDGTDTQPKV